MRTATVIKVVVFAFLLSVLGSCKKCQENGIRGEISQGMYEGHFTITKNTENQGQILNVFLEKKKLRGEDPQPILSSFEQVENWKLLVNESNVELSQVFPELSNTMSEQLNLVSSIFLPDSVVDQKTIIKLSFWSGNDGFQSTASEESIKCYLKNNNHE